MAQNSSLARFFAWGLCIALFLLAAWAGVTYALLPTAAELSVLAKRNPPETAMMRARDEVERTRRKHTWVPLERIAPVLVDAVIASEDASFWIHGGVDPHELGAALREAAEGKRARGASTITQQLAKNLFLGEERTLLRKLKEVLLARRLEEALTKKRILALYLNTAEWGDGVWGAEAAAQEHFGHSAQALQPWEAAALAAMLPAPRRLAPAQHSPELPRRTERVLKFLVQRGRLSQMDADAALAQVRRFIGEPPAAP